jgi:hypothetical protein
MRSRVIQILLTVAVFATAGLVSIAQNSAHHTAEETINVAGKWTVSAQGQGHHGGGTQNMTIQQAGNKISGNIQGQQGQGQLEGSLDGNSIRFTVNMNTHHGATTFEYRGTVEGDSMKGAMQGPMGAVSWSAKRNAE